MNVARTRLPYSYFLAEREGFEPSVAFTTHDFQSCAFDHSATSPIFGVYWRREWDSNPR